MNFWNEFSTEPKEVKTTESTEIEGIYKTKAGKYRVYARKYGKQHCVGTFSNQELAYEAKLRFLESGEKIKEPKQQKQSLESLMQEHHQQNPPLPPTNPPTNQPT